MTGGAPDLEALVSRDNQIDQLESSILIYIGKLSQLEHTDDQGREMISLARIASTLEVLSDVVTTNLAALGHQRLAGGIDLARFKDERTSEFANAVIRNLEQAIAGIGQAEPIQAEQVLAAKKPIQELAESARQSLLDKLQLSERKDVTSFSPGFGYDRAVQTNRSFRPANSQNCGRVDPLKDRRFKPHP